jgi:hypothetical protein
MTKLPALMLAVTLVGCHTEDPEMVGLAQARITQVPQQVFCVRITVAGYRTVERSFDVTPGQSSILSLSGLPVGSVTFTGAAFPASCAFIGLTPTWISEPTPAFLSAGTVANVALALKQNGGANVDVDFETPDGGVGPTPDLALPFGDLAQPPSDGGAPVDLAPVPLDSGTFPPPDLAQPQAQLTVSPTFHFYSAPGNFAFTVRNVGVQTSGAPNISISGDSRFVLVSSTCGAPLASNATCSVVVRSNVAPQGIGGEATVQIVAFPGGSAFADVAGGILP